jgi:hypothetical protein
MAALSRNAAQVVTPVVHLLFTPVVFTPVVDLLRH